MTTIPDTIEGVREMLSRQDCVAGRALATEVTEGADRGALPRSIFPTIPASRPTSCISPGR